MQGRGAADGRVSGDETRVSAGRPSRLQPPAALSCRPQGAHCGQQCEPAGHECQLEGQSDGCVRGVAGRVCGRADPPRAPPPPPPPPPPQCRRRSRATRACWLPCMTTWRSSSASTASTWMPWPPCSSTSRGWRDRVRGGGERGGLGCGRPLGAAAPAWQHPGPPPALHPALSCPAGEASPLEYSSFPVPLPPGAVRLGVVFFQESNRRLAQLVHEAAREVVAALPQGAPPRPPQRGVLRRPPAAPHSCGCSWHGRGRALPCRELIPCIPAPSRHQPITRQPHHLQTFSTTSTAPRTTISPYT